MADIAADRDLLFGLLALQNGLIDQGQLVAAFQAWTRDRDRPLAEHLAARGDLDPEQCGGVEAMVGLHLRKHGGDAAKSLADVPIGRSTRESLTALRDPRIEATLEHVAGGSTDPDADRTASHVVGTATADGQRFRVLRPHARGGLGAVFVALDAELNREVALKQILDHHADDPDSRHRFLIEAEVTGGLEHPGIVPVYGLGTYADGRPYYAMRFIKGDSLKRAIERFHADASLKADPGRRSLALRELLRRFTDVCNAIDYAHSRGVLHRDIKPGNIIVGKHGETLVVDWGLAKAMGHVEPGGDAGERTLMPSSASGSAETLPGSALGTPAYMSPEQASGHLDRLGPRSDVYSLGATLYCLLAGRPPAEGDIGEVLGAVQRGEFPPPRQLDPTIDRALEAVCLKAMATRPDDRYPSCKALAEDIERWAADEPVSAYPERWPARAARWARRRKTLVVAAAVLLVTAAVASTTAAGLVWREQQQTRRAWERAEAEHAEASKNAEAAIEVVRNLSVYVESYEMGSGNTGVNSMQVRKDRLDAALASYERLLGLHPDDRAVRWNVARMYRNRGNLCRFLDKLADAEVSYGRAIRLLERLAAESPETLIYREVHALTLQDLGGLWRRLGRAREADELSDGAIRLFEGLHRARPDEPNPARVLANLLVSRSDREFQAGRWSDSEASARRSADLYARLAEAPGTRPEPLDPLFHAMAEHNLALALREQGRSDEALAAHDRAADRMAGLTKVTNSRDAWSFLHRVRTERAWTQGRLRGRAEAAVADLEAAIRGWDALNKQLGETPVDLERKAVAGLYCGRLKALLGRREAAVADLSAAAAVLRKLVDAQPRIPAYRHDLGRVYAALGQAAGDPRDAPGWYRKAREMLDGAVRQHPENVPFRRALADLDALTAPR